MKRSFYIVLLPLGILPAILSDRPYLYCCLFLLILFFLSFFLKEDYQLKYEEMAIMEMVYNNDYKKYKRQALFDMIEYTAAFVFLLLLFIISLFSDNPLTWPILSGIYTITIGSYSLEYIRSYVRVRKAGRITLDNKLQERYLSYKDERDTRTYEEMLLPRPKHYKAINTANTIFAILSIVIGLLTITISYAYRGEFHSFVEILSIFYGTFAFYWGIKDLLNTSNSQKYLLLLLSCILVVLLYIPFTSYLDKTFLTAYIGDDSNLSYDAKSNLVQKIIRVDEIASFEPTYRRKRFILALSSEGQKKLLENIIRVNAEYQVVYKDSTGKKQVITIAPSELKKIYHQTKSNLDIFLEILKLDFNGAKVYEDGEYIIIEYLENKNIPYSTQPEQVKAFVKNYTRKCAEDYGIAVFNRGIRMRFIFNNNQFIEYSLSLEEIKKAKENMDLKESKETFDGFVNIFSCESTENQHE